MSTIDTSTWNPDPALNESIGDIPLNSNASIAQTWQAIQMLMAAGGLHGLQLVTFDGATASADGKQGLVPAPEAGDQDKVLKGDGTWGTISASDIPNIDASKITSGTIDLARLPAGALERLVTVADQTARYALTTADVQLGDTVKQLDTGVMYIVVDTAKLGQAGGYVEYTAGSATSVPWSGVTDKPSNLAFTDSDITGNAATATKLAAARTINGVSFDGSANITVADSTKVAKSGDTMTGDLEISKTSPHVNLRNTALIRATAPEADINQVEILGKDYNNKALWGLYHNYLTDKTHRIRLICYNGLTTDSSYAEIGVGYDSSGVAYTNAPHPSSATDTSSKIATTYWVRNATGNFACNAATATKLASSHSVSLTGDVTGSASSQAGWSVAAKRRSCLLGQNSSSSSDPWYKVATYAVTLTNVDAEITFLVEDTFQTHTFGILRANVRSDGSKILSTSASRLQWLSHTGFNLKDFVLVLPAEASATAELWTKIDRGWQYRRFTVISEGTRSASVVQWILLNASSAGQEASIPTAGTQIESTMNGVPPLPANVSNPERTVLCADGVWRDISQIENLNGGAE